ncbi:MAG TPA: ATP-binding protein, partial [Thermoanaerobaculia bacterium]|nr:ATP-binding protein [Thermoanaerobaculia bacterium]
AMDVTGRVKTERRQALQLAVTEVLVDATTPAEAVPRLLEVVCKRTGWQVGEFWSVDSGAAVLRREAAYRLPLARLAAFVEAGRDRKTPRGLGLTGRAWESEAPVAASGEDLFALPWGAEARAASLREAIALPVESGGRVLAVVTFFRRARRGVDEDAVAILSGVAQEIGPFLEGPRQQEVAWPDAGFVSGILKDVAGRRQAEERIRLLAHAVESSDEMISIADLDRRFTYANRAFLQTYGVSEDDVVGKEARFLASSIGEPARSETVASRALLGGFAGTLYDTKKDGTEFPIALRTSPVKNGQGRVIALVNVARDITQALAAEEALRRSEEYLRSIFAGALDGVITIGPQALVESCNPAAERIFGRPREEIVGRPAESFLPDLLQAMGVLPRVLEMEGLRKEGSRVPLEVSLFAVHHASRRTVAAFLKDVSARREVERLRQELVAVVSHDLKTPLASVRLSLGLLSEGTLGPIPPAVRDVVAVAERNVERMVRLANDLLDLKRLEAGRMEMCLDTLPVQGIIDRCLEVVRPVAVAHGVVLGGEPSPLKVVADGERLGQVVTNLLSNAIKFSPPGGKVTVEAIPAGASVEVRVTDEGRGIPTSHRETVFEPFRQVLSSDQREKKGSGLGLAICKAIVQQHGGTIGVASEEGKGSRFWFRLPPAPGGTESQD